MDVIEVDVKNIASNTYVWVFGRILIDGKRCVYASVYVNGLEVTW